MSQLTTHILDTTVGKPAAGVAITLFQQLNDGWKEKAGGITNADGRIPGLLPADEQMEYGVYKMVFHVKPYFDAKSVKSFYPVIEIIFEISSGDHYHVPLLLNPYGYSTYRGS